MRVCGDDNGSVDACMYTETVYMDGVLVCAFRV